MPASFRTLLRGAPMGITPVCGNAARSEIDAVELFDDVFELVRDQSARPRTDRDQAMTAVKCPLALRAEPRRRAMR